MKKLIFATMLAAFAVAAQAGDAKTCQAGNNTAQTGCCPMKAAAQAQAKSGSCCAAKKAAKNTTAKVLKSPKAMSLASR